MSNQSISFSDIDAENQNVIMKHYIYTITEHARTVLIYTMIQWKEIIQDPKYDELVHRIKSELMDKSINDNHKLIVFSESKETTDYLAKRLKKDNFTRLISVDSSNQRDLTDVIEANFDANIKLEDQLNDVDIIITSRCRVIIIINFFWNFPFS